MKMTLRFLLKHLALGAALLASVQGRTWTSADGTKTFEGTLKAYDAEKGEVVVALRNGRTLRFSQATLSEADIAYLQSNGTPASGGGLDHPLPEVIPDPDGQEADMSKPVQVYILMGQSNMLGFGKSDTLKTIAPEKYPYLVDEVGEWTVRKDVRNVRVMCSGNSPAKDYINDWMTTSGRIGPEIGIGYALGHVTDAPVMILKSCIGNRSLGWDLLPPGSEPYEHGGQTQPGYRGTPEDPQGNGKPVEGKWYAGCQYDGDVAAAKKVLENRTCASASSGRRSSRTSTNTTPVPKDTRSLVFSGGRATKICAIPPTSNDTSKTSFSSSKPCARTLMPPMPPLSPLLWDRPRKGAEEVTARSWRQ